MGGVPSPSILDLYNKASICIDLGWTPEQYRRAPSRDTQAIIVVMDARARKQKSENKS
jgi:hypothetical protein